MDLDIGVKYLGDPWGVDKLPQSKRTQIRAYWRHCHTPMKQPDPPGSNNTLLRSMAEASGVSLSDVRGALGGD